MPPQITNTDRRQLRTRPSRIRARYRAAGRADKLRILDEFVAVTGYHRKHVIRMLNSADVPRKPKRVRLRVYDEAVREALIVLWEASDPSAESA
jgi:hypothetical protein